MRFNMSNDQFLQVNAVLLCIAFWTLRKLKREEPASVNKHLDAHRLFGRSSLLFQHNSRGM